MNKGFTLVELLITIGMISILSTAAIVVINPVGQISKSHDAQRKAALSQIQRGLELYYQDNGRYPDNSADYKISNNANTYQWGNAWNPYMASIPKDPLPTRSFVYYSPPSSSGQTYYIYASLEIGTDKQMCNSGNACVSIQTGGAGVPSPTACGTTCNYGVSSPNVTP